MIYDELLKEADNCGLIVKEKPLKGSSGRIKGSRIAIKKDILTNEKICALAEELGHYHTTVGDILDQSKIENRKQENKARRWAVKKLIRIEQLIDAFNAGIRNKFELAEFLEVPETFLETALEHFKGIYGICKKIDEYIIYFDPLYIYKQL